MVQRVVVAAAAGCVGCCPGPPGGGAIGVPFASSESVLLNKRCCIRASDFPVGLPFFSLSLMLDGAVVKSNEGRS